MQWGETTVGWLVEQRVDLMAALSARWWAAWTAEQLAAKMVAMMAAN